MLEYNNLKYEIIIGTEIHCQLLTKTKAFCSCENKYGGGANLRVCPVCLGLPGALPTTSKEYVEYGIKAGYALKCKINNYSRFDRKHYFYPDLAKGYQITQFYYPLCGEGGIDINIAGQNEKPCLKHIGIERIHLEEDAGKSLHIEGNHSYIDYNRCGVPLIEIVSKPDMSSGEEASIFMQTIREILRFIGITDGNLEEGAMRCDANVNVRIIDGDVEFRTCISEIKNMNSFKAVKDACSYEVMRQLKEYESGTRLAFKLGEKRTMGWDDATGETVMQRTKTEAEDYRFMREPDLKALKLSDEYINEVSSSVGELPSEKRDRYRKNYSLSEFDVYLLTSEKSIATWFEKAVEHSTAYKKVANWILTNILSIINEQKISIDELKVKPIHIAQLVNLIEEGKITSNQAKEVFSQMVETGKEPSIIAKEKGLELLDDDSEIAKLVDDVFAKNIQAIEQWKNGKTNVLGWLVGQVMKESKGKANPSLANKLVVEKLKNS